MASRYGNEFLSRAMLALLLIGLLTSYGNSQTTTSAIETRSTEKPAAQKRGDALKEAAQNKATCTASVPCIREKVDALRLSYPRRFVRGFQYQYELTEQPATVFVSQGTGVGEVTAFLRNPQDFLEKHTLTFKFGELFPEHLPMFKRASDYLKTHPEAANESLPELLCEGKPLITCLTKGRSSWWKRALMGTTVNAYFSQRALVQQQVIAPASRFGKDYLVNGGFVFDPAKLFPTATNWKSTFDDVKNIDKALAVAGAYDYTKEPWKQPWAAIIPKVEYKILSQFDFIKYQGALVQPNFTKPALSTWTFTWDLARAIPDLKSRLDADAIAEAVADLKNDLGTEPKSISKKGCILHFDQGVVRKVKDLHPGFSGESCQQLAQVMDAKKYQLSCVLVDEKGAEKEWDDGPVTDLGAAPVNPAGNLCRWSEVKRN